MPDGAFLQQFHDLAASESQARCVAALAVRETLKANAKKAEDESLAYAVRRLVRGVQSSRQCARQGFSLALSELLAAFPDELGGVMTLVSQLTEIQAGLKSNEQKDRLLGRLFAYVAIFQSGCLCKEQSPRTAAKKALSEIGRGLHEIFVARPYIRAPAVRLLMELGKALCSAGLAADVPELLGGWSLDSVGDAVKDPIGASTLGAVLELQVLRQQVEASSGSPSASLKAWPSATRRTPALLTQSAAFEQFLDAAIGEVAGSPQGDAIPVALAQFVQWWIHSSKSGSSTSPGLLTPQRVWQALDGKLFPEKASHTAQVQSLRTLADLASVVIVEVGGRGAAEEAVVVAFFEHMHRGLALLFRALTCPRSPVHTAAIFAHARLVGSSADLPALPTLAALEEPEGTSKRQHQQQKRQKGGQQSDVCRWSGALSSDKARLRILAALQQHREFGAMSNALQRQWHQVLLAPLSDAGVRTRCAALLRDVATAGSQASKEEGGSAGADVKLGDARVAAVQLEQLTMHSRAPDEVILAVACFLFSAAFCAPAESVGAACSLRSFCEGVGMAVSSSIDDLTITTPPPPAGDKSRLQAAIWRTKFWSIIGGLVRRPLPDMVLKLTASRPGEAAQSESQDQSAQTIRTHAFHGCFSDGSLLVLRLHEWWDFLTSSGGKDDGIPNKKKRRKDGDAGKFHFEVELGADDSALRQGCLERCKKVLQSPDGEGGLSSRQRSALCNLPLCLVLSILSIDNEEDKKSSREFVTDLMDVVGRLDALTPAKGGKDAQHGKKAKPQQKLSEMLASVPCVAAELYVNGTGLVKEAARNAWRELGEFISDETITSLCASIRDAPEDDEDDDDEEETNSKKVKKHGKVDGGEDDEEDEDGDDDEDEDEEEEDSAPSGAKAAKIAAYQKATEALRVARQAEDGAGVAGGDGSDDEITMDRDTMFEQLLGDAGGQEDAVSGGGGALLAAFASSGLDAADAAGPKVSKRQQRLKQRQDDIVRKFRELDLIEIFLTRFVDTKPASLEVLTSLYQFLVATCRRAVGSQGGDGGTDGAAGGARKKTKADANLRQLENALAQRIAKLLARVLRQACRAAVVSKMCQWNSGQDWAATKARDMYSLGLSSKLAAAGPRPLEVGALMLYFFCAADRAAISNGAGDSTEAASPLAKELLERALEDWSSKKDGERWCAAVIEAFVARAPRAVLALPWAEQIRCAASRKPFVQRAQLAFVSERLLQGLPPEVQPNAVPLAKVFGDVCAEALESTLAPAEAKEGAMSAAQRQKLRRESLRGLKACLRVRTAKDAPNGGGGGGSLFSKGAAAKIAAAAAQVRDALPARHGEVYQLCLHVLRSPRLAVAGSSTAGASSASEGGGKGAKRARTPTKGAGAAAAGAAAPGGGASAGKRRKERAHDSASEASSAKKKPKA